MCNTRQLQKGTWKSWCKEVKRSELFPFSQNSFLCLKYLSMPLALSKLGRFTIKNLHRKKLAYRSPSFVLIIIKYSSLERSQSRKLFWLCKTFKQICLFFIFWKKNQSLIFKYWKFVVQINIICRMFFLHKTFYKIFIKLSWNFCQVFEISHFSML